MLLAAPSPPPIVRPASTQIGESEAVRATISRAASGLVYLVRFRIVGSTVASGLGCVASASLRVPGSRRARRVGLVARGVWCTGEGLLTVAADRRRARTGTAHLWVLPPAALGQGNVVGHLLLGPTCPVEHIDDPCDPVAHPEPVTFVALDASGPRLHGRSRLPMAASRSISARAATPCMPIGRARQSPRLPTRTWS